MTVRVLLLPALALLLAACGDGGADGPGARPDGANDPLLPVPQAGRNGVTGMPDAGTPGPVEAPVATDPSVPVDAEGNPVLPDAVADDDATDPLDDGGAGTDAALGVLRDYYGALNAGDFGAARGLWADGGQASNQSPEAFAQGFAGVRGISVELGTPSGLEASPDGRTLQVPVTLVATQEDGTQRRSTGVYTLRRAAADGGPQDASGWRIAAADLRDAGP